MYARLLFVSLLAGLLLTGGPVHGQDRPAGAQWPDLGSKEAVLDLDPQQLTPAEEAKPTWLDPFVGEQDPDRKVVNDFFSQWNGQHGIDKSTLKADLLMHHYPHVTVKGHYRGDGLAATVESVAIGRVFWKQSDNIARVSPATEHDGSVQWDAHAKTNRHD